ncbi:MAG: hypothetical protein ACR2PZ_12985 [Pseudomonadales bacterium]
MTLAVVLISCWQINAHAASTSSGAWTLLHVGDFDWRQRTDRLRVASDLRRRVVTLSARVPTQSPEELARVAQREAKLGEDQAQARSRLYLSAEYQHRELHKTLEQINEALLCVERSERIGTEMACWGDAAVALLKEDQMRLALDTLRKKRRIPRKRNTPIIDRDPDLWYAHFGRGILTSLIAPYLNDLAKREVEVQP